MENHFTLNLYFSVYINLVLSTGTISLISILVFIVHLNNTVVKPYLSGYRSVMHINSIISAGISHLKIEYGSVFYS